MTDTETKQLQERIDEELRKVIIFPGNKAEYEEMFHQEVEPVNLFPEDSEDYDKGLVYHFNKSNPFATNYGIEYQVDIMNAGVIALINVQVLQNFERAHKIYYGLPVRLKEKK